MATWFAQFNNNINTANMWNSVPAGGGTVLTWPPATNDILVANNRTVTINVNTHVAQVRNDTTGGATSGGSFTLSTAGASLTANITGGGAGGTTGGCVRVGNTTGTVYIVGTIRGSDTTNNRFGVSCTGNGTLQVTGSINSGAASSGLNVTSGNRTLNITGDITSASALTSDHSGIRLAAAGAPSLTVTGNATGGTGTSAIFCGDVPKAVALTGYAQGGSSAFSLGAAIYDETILGDTVVGSTRSGSDGTPGVYGPYRYASATLATDIAWIAGTQKTLSVLDVAALVPAEADVRAGVVYGDGAYAGEYAVSVSGGRKVTTMAGRF